MNFSEPPYSQEAEEAVLGAVLINQNTFDILSSFLRADDFFFLRHAYIWQAMWRLRDRRDHIDPLTVSNELDQLGFLKDIGGPAFLTQLMNSTPTSSHAEVYGRLVERASIRRGMMRFADETKARAMDETSSVEDLVAETERSYMEYVLSRVGNQDGRSVKEIMSDLADELEIRMNSQQKILGIRTGLRDLDTILLGLKPGTLNILAGRPGMGKTALALKFVKAALEQDRKVGFVSMEMGVEQIARRLITLMSDVPYQVQEAGTLKPHEYERVLPAFSWYTKHSNDLFLNDAADLNPSQLRSKAWTWKRQNGLDLLIVDYLQLMNSGNPKHNRREEITYISRRLKLLSKELGIPIVALSQLSRGVENRQDKRPIMSDLYESGGIEADADVVMFTYRDAVYNENCEFPNQADIIVAKHRNGATGVASVYYDKTVMHFQDMTRRKVDLGKDIRDTFGLEQPGETD